MNVSGQRVHRPAKQTWLLPRADHDAAVTRDACDPFASPSNGLQRRVQRVKPRTIEMRLGHVAADCVARAIARGVYEASSLGNIKSYRDTFQAKFGKGGKNG